MPLEVTSACLYRYMEYVDRIYVLCCIIMYVHVLHEHCCQYHFLDTIYSSETVLHNIGNCISKLTSQPRSAPPDFHWATNMQMDG